MSEKISKEVFLKRLNKIYETPNIEIEEWNGYTKKIVYYCYICGERHTKADARLLLEQQSFCTNETFSGRWDISSFKRRIEKIFPNKIEIITYTGLSNPLIYKCLKCGEIKKIAVARNIFSKFSLCNICEGTEKEVIRKKIDKIFLNNKNFELLVWRGTNKKADVKCLNCGKIAKRRPINIIQCPNCCPSCNNGAIKQKKDFSLVQQEIDSVFGEKSYTLLEYNGALNKKSKIRCNSCGLIFNCQISTFSKDTRGCPKCKRFKSKGEQLITRLLEELNANFETQKHFPDCNNNLSSFDFCIYSQNGDFSLLEVNGIQHYKQTSRFGELKIIQERDSKKINYCKEHNIPLYVIPYYKLKDIDNIKKLLFSLTRSTTISNESREESVVFSKDATY